MLDLLKNNVGGTLPLERVRAAGAPIAQLNVRLLKRLKGLAFKAIRGGRVSLQEAVRVVEQECSDFRPAQARDFVLKVSQLTDFLETKNVFFFLNESLGVVICGEISSLSRVRGITVIEARDVASNLDGDSISITSTSETGIKTKIGLFENSLASEQLKAVASRARAGIQESSPPTEVVQALNFVISEHIAFDNELSDLGSPLTAAQAKLVLDFAHERNPEHAFAELESVVPIELLIAARLAVTSIEKAKSQAVSEIREDVRETLSRQTRSNVLCHEVHHALERQRQLSLQAAGREDKLSAFYSAQPHMRELTAVLAEIAFGPNPESTLFHIFLSMLLDSIKDQNDQSVIMLSNISTNLLNAHKAIVASVMNGPGLELLGYSEQELREAALFMLSSIYQRTIGASYDETLQTRAIMQEYFEKQQQATAR